VEAAELWTSLPPALSLSSLKHFLSWEELATVPHSLPAAQDLEEVFPNWARACAMTWDADFKKWSFVHVMQPLQSSWWGFFAVNSRVFSFIHSRSSGKW